MGSTKKGLRNRTILGAGLLIFAVVQLVATFSNLNSGKTRAEQFATPGSKTIEIDVPGTYHLWYHYLTVYEGQPVKHSSNFPKEITIGIRDSDGNELTLSHTNKSSWRIGNHAKKSLGHIDFATNQTVTVTAEGGPQKGAILSLSLSDLKGELWAALGGFAYAVAAAIIGLPLLIWGLLITKS